MWIQLCHWQFKVYVITKTGRSPRIVRRGSKRYQGNRDTIDKLFPSIPAGGNNPSPSQKLITDPQTGKHRCVTVVFIFFRLFEVWVATFLTLNQSFSSNIHHKRRGGGSILPWITITENLKKLCRFQKVWLWKIKCCWSIDG